MQLWPVREQLQFCFESWKVKWVGHAKSYATSWRQSASLLMNWDKGWACSGRCEKPCIFAVELGPGLGMLWTVRKNYNSALNLGKWVGHPLCALLLEAGGCNARINCFRILPSLNSEAPKVSTASWRQSQCFVLFSQSMSFCWIPLRFSFVCMTFRFKFLTFGLARMSERKSDILNQKSIFDQPNCNFELWNG